MACEAYKMPNPGSLLTLMNKVELSMTECETLTPPKATWSYSPVAEMVQKEAEEEEAATKDTSVNARVLSGEAMCTTRESATGIGCATEERLNEVHAVDARVAAGARRRRSSSIGDGRFVRCAQRIFFILIFLEIK